MGEDVDGERGEVEKDVMVEMEGMEVGVRRRATALKVFSADEADVDVCGVERDGAARWEIKVEERPFDCFEVERVCFGGGVFWHGGRVVGESSGREY